MFIALINWRILPDQVDAFLDDWKTRLTLAGKPGLIGEFLSKIEDSGFHAGVTWEMEEDVADDKSLWVSEEYVSFVNVGIWNSAEDFLNAVGAWMTAGRTIGKPFEAAPRRRAFLTPEHWRVGSSSLPTSASPGVSP